MIANIFSHSIDCLDILLMVSFAVQKIFSLIQSHFLKNCFCCLYTWCQIQKAISKTYVKEVSAYVFWKFYGFRSNLFLGINICLLFCFRLFLPLFTYTTVSLKFISAVVLSFLLDRKINKGRKCVHFDH